MLPPMARSGFLGSTFRFYWDRLAFLAHLARQGDIVRFTLLGRPCVLINHPSYVRELLISNAHAFDKGREQHSTFRALLGNSLSILEGEEHAHERAMLMQYFVRRSLLQFPDFLTEAIDDRLSGWSDGDLIDVHREADAIVQDGFVRLLFGRPIRELPELQRARDQIWAWMNRIASERRGIARLRDLRRALVEGTWARGRRRSEADVAPAIRQARSVIAQLLDDLRRHPGAPRSLADSIVRARYANGTLISETRALDECVMLYFTANATSASAISWAIYLLLRHPDLYTSVQGEIDSFASRRPLSMQTIEELPLVNRALQEAMRLYPPASWQARVAVCDTTIGGYSIPAGTTVVLSQYLLHRRHTSGRESFTLTPQQEPRNGDPPLAYIPFGAGARACLGRHYVEREGPLVLANIMRRFALEPRWRGEIHPELRVALEPRHPIVVRVKDRGTWRHS